MKKSILRKNKKTSNGKFDENSKLTKNDESSLSCLPDTNESPEEMKKRLSFQLQFLSKEENFISE